MTSEDDLRRILGEQAENAPDGAPLAERALAGLHVDVARPRRPRRWVVPAVAAAGLVVAASAAAVWIKTATEKPAAELVPTIATTSFTTPTSTPTRGHTSAQSSASSTPPPSTASVEPAYEAASISFDAAGDGFAIASRGCASEVCRGYLLKQPLGAQGWTSSGVLIMPVSADIAACSDLCVHSVRFATAKDGYLFGPDVLYSTIDAGRTWTRKSAAVVDLEASTSAVVRVTTSTCAPECTFTIAAAKVGQPRWHPATLPGGPVTGRSAYLTSVGDQTFFLGIDTADPANDALFQSVDGGLTWTLRRHGLCAVSADQSELSDVAADAAGTVVDYICSGASSHHGYRLTVAGTAAPASLGSVPAVDGVAARIAVGPTGTSLLSAGMLYVDNASTRHQWKPVRVPRADGETHFLGYPAGRATAGEAPAMYLGPDGTALWTSLDDGKSWSSSGFG